MSAGLGTRVDGCRATGAAAVAKGMRGRGGGVIARVTKVGDSVGVFVGPIPGGERSVFLGGGLERSGSRLLLKLECSKVGLGFPKLVP